MYADFWKKASIKKKCVLIHTIHYGKDRNNIPYWNTPPTIIFTNLIHYFIQQESSTLQKIVHRLTTLHVYKNYSLYIALDLPFSDHRN